MKAHRAKQDSSLAKTKACTIPIKDEIFLQPWFLPADLYMKIRSLLPHIHLFKMHYYYDDWGCLRCGNKEGLYVANGLCKTCSGVVRARIVISLRRRLRKAGLPADYKPTSTFQDAIRRRTPFINSSCSR